MLNHVGGSQHTQNIILGEKENCVSFLWKRPYGLFGQCSTEGGRDTAITGPPTGKGTLAALELAWT